MKNFEKKKITFEKTRILYETKSLNLSVIKKLTSNATHAECQRYRLIQIARKLSRNFGVGSSDHFRSTGSIFLIIKNCLKSKIKPPYQVKLV